MWHNWVRYITANSWQTHKVISTDVLDSYITMVLIRTTSKILSFSGGQLLSHWFGLKAEYKWACKTIEFPKMATTMLVKCMKNWDVIGFAIFTGCRFSSYSFWSNLLFIVWFSLIFPRGGGGGGTRSENCWGCAAGHWKLDPKRSWENGILGPKRSNFARICTQKIVFVLVDEKKHPKKIVLDPAKVKKGGQNRGTYVSPIT